MWEGTIEQGDSAMHLETNLRIIENIVHTNDRNRLEELITWVDDPDDQRLSWAAAWALDKLWHPSAAVAVARGALRTEFPAEIYPRLLGTAGMVVLLSGLHSEDRLTRMRAAQALGDVGDLRAVTGLEAALSPGMNNNCDVIAAALLKLGPDDVRERTMKFLMTSSGPLDARMGGYNTRGHDVLAFLEPYLESEDKKIRERAETFREAHAARAHDRSERINPSPDDISLWLGYLTKNDRVQAENSAINLARCRSLPREASGTLGQVLAKSSYGPQFDIRIPLLIALAKTGDPAAVNQILHHVRDLRIARIAVSALGDLLTLGAGEINLPALHHITDLPDETLQCWDEYDLNWNRYEEICSVDMGPVKRMAKAEIDRRTLEP